MASWARALSSASGAMVITNDVSFSKGRCRAIYVGTGGDISIVIGGATVMLKNAPSGGILPIEATKVNASGTTAENLVALY